MPQMLEIRGLPDRLARDGWWLTLPELSGGPGPGDGRPTRYEAAGGAGPVLVLLALVLLAECLFWGRAAGLSVAVFCFVAVAICAAGRSRGTAGFAIAIVAVGTLPVIEHAQALSFAFAAASLLLGVAVVQTRSTEIPGVLLRARDLIAAIPLTVPRDVLPALTRLSPPSSEMWRAILRGWAFPLGGSLVLAALMIEANPVLSGWVDQVSVPRINAEAAVTRILFWLGLALCLWPFLSPPPFGAQRTLTVPAVRIGLNPGSVLRALVLFNLLLGVQTAMDAALLWGDGALPAGMTYAEYAHRGAYPLLATALLAGAFAVAARPHLGARGLRPLMMLWLAQNVALCFSCLYRMDIYIDTFGLTYLRIHVLIWIAVVAAGLALTAWQVWHRRSTGWLMARCAGLGIAVLYLCCFVNFAQVIAARNLERDTDVDLDYLCDLPTTAAGALPAAYCGAGFRPEIEGWRDWGFREWRVIRTMAAEDPA